MRIPNRFLAGCVALSVASCSFAQSFIPAEVDYIPRQVQIEGDSPIYNFHIVDVVGPRTVNDDDLVDGEFVPTIRWVVEDAPNGVTDEEALALIDGWSPTDDDLQETLIPLPTGTEFPTADNGSGVQEPWDVLRINRDETVIQGWLQGIFTNPSLVTPDKLFFVAKNETRTVGIVFRADANTVAGSYAFRLFIEDWPDEAEGFVNNPGTLINAVLGDVADAPDPPVPAVSSPAENEEFTYFVGDDPLQIPFLVTGQSEDNAPVTSFSVSITGRGDVTSDLTIDPAGLNVAFVEGVGSLPFTVAGDYDVTVTAANSAGEAMTSVPFRVNRVVPPPTIAINSPVANETFTYTLGEETGVNVPISVTADTLEDGGPNEGIQTLTAEVNGTVTALNGVTFGALNTTGTAV